MYDGLPSPSQTHLNSQPSRRQAAEQSRAADCRYPTWQPTDVPSIRFYAPLLLVGVAFVLTACSYGIMVYKTTYGGELGGIDPEAADLVGFMDRHGAALMIGELVALGIFTVGTIGVDHYRGTRRESTGSNS